MRPNKSLKVRMRQMENKTMKIRIPAVLVVIALTITTASAQYKRTDLVSNGPTVAPFTDPHLVNAWGLVALPTSPWWTSDNGTGFSTLYNGAGQQIPLFVAVPPAQAAPRGRLARRPVSSETSAPPRPTLQSRKTECRADRLLSSRH